MTESDVPLVGPEVEARLVALLRQLAEDPPRGAPLHETVLATVRWQSAVRDAAVLVADLTAGAVDAVALLVGVRRPGGTRP